MIDRSLFKPAQLVLPLFGLAVSFVIGVIALRFYNRIPSFEHWSCGPTPTGDCLGWSLVLLGPLYLIGMILLVIIGALVVVAPALLSLSLWARKKDDSKSLLNPDSRRLPWYKIIFAGIRDESGPDA